MREQNFRAAAFDAVCRDAKEPETWYLCLIESWQRYGGGEEGGWWYEQDGLSKYQEFASEKEAKKAANRIYALADELNRRQRGEITTGDGYQIPKADKPASVVEVNAVLKEVGRNKRRNNRKTSRGGGDKGEDKNNKEMKPNPASDNKASATKKQPTSQVN